jgi:hypothetical protein
MVPLGRALCEEDLENAVLSGSGVDFEVGGGPIERRKVSSRYVYLDALALEDWADTERRKWV